MNHWKLVFHILATASLAGAFAFSSTAGDFPPVPHEIANVEFKRNQKPYSLELLPLNGAELDEAEEGTGYCGNPDGSPEIHSDCDLVLKEDATELSRITLQECQFVYSKDKWLVRGMPPLRLLARGNDYPLISIGQYAGCNGNMYYLFWIEEVDGKPVMKPVTFVGFPYTMGNNEVWADPAENAVQLILSHRSHKYELWTKGYDNAGLFSFIAQYGELSPGQWQVIGLYTEAGGTYGMEKSKFLGK
jgi:hypothetical protein